MIASCTSQESATVTHPTSPGASLVLGNGERDEAFVVVVTGALGLRSPLLFAFLLPLRRALVAIGWTVVFRRSVGTIGRCPFRPGLVPVQRIGQTVNEKIRMLFDVYSKLFSYMYISPAISLGTCWHDYLILW